MALSFLKKKEELFLGIDIGTEALKVLVVEKSLDDKIFVLASDLIYFNNLFQDKIKEALSRSIDNIKKEIEASSLSWITKKKVRRKKHWKSVVNISPDILQIRVFQDFFARDSKAKINKKEKELIFETILSRAKKQILRRLGRGEEIASSNVVWTCFLCLESKIDGYEVDDIEGYQGKNIEAMVAAQFLPRDYFQEIKKSLKDTGVEIEKITSGILKLPEFLNKENALVFDIGGEIAEVFYFRKAALRDAFEIKKGGRIFTQKISKKLKISEEFARNLKERYGKGELSEASEEKIKKLLAREKTSWRKELKFITEEKYPLFSKLVFFGGGGLIPEISETLNGLGVEFLKPKDLNIIKNETRILENEQFTPLVLSFVQFFSKAK